MEGTRSQSTCCLRSQCGWVALAHASFAKRVWRFIIEGLSVFTVCRARKPRLFLHLGVESGIVRLNQLHQSLREFAIVEFQLRLASMRLLRWQEQCLCRSHCDWSPDVQNSSMRCASQDIFLALQAVYPGIKMTVWLLAGIGAMAAIFASVEDVEKARQFEPNRCNIVLLVEQRWSPTCSMM